MTNSIQTAWDLIGFDGQINGLPATVRIVGGTARYEAVDYNATRLGDKVRLARIVPADEGRLRQINRWVRADTLLEVVMDDA